jgi:hypothetical protein
MLNDKHFVLIAGNPTKWDNEIREKVGKVGSTFESKSLSEMQIEQASKGRLSANLIRSIYGWTVRYASGLQDFSILYASRKFDIKQALEFGIEWANNDPENREFYVSKTEIQNARNKGDDLTAYDEFINLILEN